MSHVSNDQLVAYIHRFCSFFIDLIEIVAMLGCEDTVALHWLNRLVRNDHHEQQHPS